MLDLLTTFLSVCVSSVLALFGIFTAGEERMDGIQRMILRVSLRQPSRAFVSTTSDSRLSV